MSTPTTAKPELKGRQEPLKSISLPSQSGDKELDEATLEARAKQKLLGKREPTVQRTINGNVRIDF